MIGFLRTRFPGLTLVLGGGLVTSWLRRPGWRNPFGGLVDHLVDGPGELPLLRLLGAEEPLCHQVPPAYDPLPLHDYLSPDWFCPTAPPAAATGTAVPSVPSGPRETPTAPAPSSGYWPIWRPWSAGTNPRCCTFLTMPSVRRSCGGWQLPRRASPGMASPGSTNSWRIPISAGISDAPDA